MQILQNSPIIYMQILSVYVGVCGPGFTCLSTGNFGHNELHKQTCIEGKRKHTQKETLDCNYSNIQLLPPLRSLKKQLTKYLKNL